MARSCIGYHYANCNPSDICMCVHVCIYISCIVIYIIYTETYSEKYKTIEIRRDLSAQTRDC